MNKKRSAKRIDRVESVPSGSLEPESGSVLLHEARGWAGSAREALSRLESDQAAHLLETQRRNGPGQ